MNKAKQVRKGKLIVVGGPMFSGKTTWLLNYIDKLVPGSFLLFKPTMDIRYRKDACVAHDGKMHQAINLDVKNPLFPQLKKGIRTILLDEANFFNAKKLLPVMEEQLRKGRTVVAAGLFYDAFRAPFGATLPLAEIADEVITLFAVCDKCGGKAGNSYRKVKEHTQVLLGSAEVYGTCCDSCRDLLH